MAKIFGFLVIWALGFLVLATTPSYAQEDYISPDLEKPKGLPNPGSLNATPTWPAPLPKGLKMPEALDPKTVLAAFMGLPFRVDGAVNDQGEWSTWEDQKKIFRTKGLNCSGFTAAVSRFLLGRNFRLDDLRSDRQNDSGPNAPLGKDWDFGLDVVLNLAEGYFLRYLPEPTTPTLAYNEKKRPVGWGVNVHSPEFLGLLGELLPGRLYLFVVSKPDRRFKGGLSYYHLGLALADPVEGVWLYHVTPKAGAHRLNLTGPKGLAAIRRYFPEVRAGGERRILFLELAPPSVL